MRTLESRLAYIHVLDNLTEWEREKEREEFLKVANDFKKVPDVMASRFQSAGQLGTFFLFMKTYLFTTN